MAGTNCTDDYGLITELRFQVIQVMEKELTFSYILKSYRNYNSVSDLKSNL